MSLVLSIYTKESFKEYILPSINNSDYTIVLYKDYFHLSNDLQIELEVMDECWYIKKSLDYVIDTDTHKGYILKNKDILKLKNKSGEEISIIVKKVENTFMSYPKYKLKNITLISIGKDQTNDIVYNYLGMVSKNHAEIIKSGNSYKIVNKSPNGIYVNSLHIENDMELNFGDYINIVGLHMVFLGDMIAIDVENSGAKISNKLKKYSLIDEETVFLNVSNEKSQGKYIYHRSPRNYEKIIEDEIEIEAPPQLNKTKQQPLIMAIGPSATMALPMLLGCMMMIYSSSQDGGSSSLYMYSGLIMAISSALIGVIWALVNIRYQKKEDKERELHRLSAYKEYLVEKTDEIKEKYEIVEKKLNSSYPSADNCIENSINSGLLWNRNTTHKDFLSHRLGLGNMAFPLKMNIPKKRFVLYKDELTEKPQFIKDNYQTLYDVPILVDLIKENLIGVVGGANKKGAIEISKILSTQIAANNCYTDVKLGFIYNQDSSNDDKQWDFAKWLPHVWAEDKKNRFIATCKEEASDVFYELTKVFRSRTENQQDNNTTNIPKPYYVIFISDLSLLEGELFSKYVFDENSKCGLTTILLTEQYEQLPNNCKFIIENTDNFQGMYNVFDDESSKEKIKFDSIDEKRLEQFSRNLSGMQVLEIEEGGEIPNSITFFEMMKINKLEELNVKELWAKNRIYENIRGIIGEKAGGVPCYLDVHEKYHGPHGLVAGTTGSGKSETLQTYMLSLAVNYSPDDIGFFIIDYKGGGMANLFDGMPHMVGQISNLSGNQVKRAMISIKSENRRRQRVFTENGVNNINAYTKLYKNGETLVPVPHLFIIIDEFAELKREEPDFMRELISVAQVGRSLGVHLILATQKPSGTVDDNIWSNSKFRLCLRVQDQQDSKDMLHKPDAAYITQAGRCYLQVGNDEVYELFQSGFSGAVYDESVMSENADIAKLINNTGKTEMTGNSVKQRRKKRAEISWIELLVQCVEFSLEKLNFSLLSCLDSNEKMNKLIAEYYIQLKSKGVEYQESKYNSARLIDFIKLYVEGVAKNENNSLPETILKLAVEERVKLPQAKEKTQLDAVKTYLAKVAKENGYNHKLQLWMPILPDHIYLNEFEEYEKTCFKNGEWSYQKGEWNLSVIVGKMDDPENQNQMPLSIDFSIDGNVAVLGTIVCGKSTMMQTIAYALIEKYSPDIVNIYAIDFSSKMMSAFENAPHFGGVMYENDIDKISKFFNMINSVLETRKELFRGGNYKQYVQINGIKLPSIVIFIDNYAAFKEKTEEAYEEQLIRLSKEGISHGIFLVISGAGYGMNDITTRVGENINTVLCLSMQDKYAYGDYLHTMQIEVMPESGVKGRGLAFYGSRILEYQTALSLEAENDYQRMEKINALCKEMKQSWKGSCAKRIPEIPDKPIWSEFSTLDEFKNALNLPALLPVGYDASNAKVYSVPLNEIYCYLVTGGNRTGKTNFMKVLIQSALMKKSNVCVIDSPNRVFHSYENVENIIYANDEQSVFNFFAELLPEFKRRNAIKRDLINQDYEEDEIFEIISKEIPYFIFISDLSWFVPFIYDAELDMRGFLENIISKGRLHNIYFIAEFDLAKRTDLIGYELYESFISHKNGIHFGGKVIDNPILQFDYLSFTEQSKPEKVGVGMIPNVSDEQKTQKVVVPLARR
jgi:S-DNA-T family DNA segregation ATPase FtsK/SpoIIIE